MEETIGKGHPDQSEGSRPILRGPSASPQDDPACGGVILRPWAKVNLFLRVLGRRSDGYHEIRTFIHPIALFDELTISRIEDGLVVDCGQENLPDNLVTKAAQLFFNRVGKSPGVKIDLLKRIPIGGGLGGGSSDAAGTLLGLNQLYGYPLSKDVLYKVCLELGMDVPFFLESRPALCSGRGEVIEKRYNSIRFWCVLVNPGKGLSTKSVYSNLILTESRAGDNIFRFSTNDLEEPAIKLCPEIGDIKELLIKAGAIKSFVCGSGSTVCGIVKEKREAEEVMRRIGKEGSRDWWIKAVSSL